MKLLLFLFALLFIANHSIYSQGACGAGYGFNVSNSGCSYTFTPFFPRPHPCIAYLRWGFASTGTYGRTCTDGFVTDTFGLSSYEFCFYGDQDVYMYIKFCDSSTCYVVHTVSPSYTTCYPALFCNPDPGNDSIPDPQVEITYIQPDTSCGIKSDAGWHGCMSVTGGGGYYTACSWEWAIRIVPSSTNCEYFTYWMQYIDGHISGQGCDSNCHYMVLTPGVVYCIVARIRQTIVIVAEGNHCCLPDGYRRGFIWTPEPDELSITYPIPGWNWGVCTNRCKNYESCNEYTQTMDQTDLPVTHCFTGGKNKTSALSGKKLLNTDQINFRILGENAFIGQHVSIYNLDGVEVFKGIWKFGDPSDFYLKWPNNLGTGLYFVKFQNSAGKGYTKLYKF